MNTSIRRIALVSSLVTIALAAPAVSARAHAQSNVMTTVDNQDIEKVLKGMGFDFTKVSDSVFKFSLNGHPTLLFNYGGDMQLYAGFRMDGSVSMKTVNEFNKANRFCKAYLDAENDPVIEYDMNFDAGVTPDAIKRQIKLFRDVLERYVTAINE